jgi:hypothetical protein
LLFPLQDLMRMHALSGGHLIDSLLTFDGCSSDFSFEFSRVVVSLPGHLSACIRPLGAAMIPPLLLV